ncbi:MAG: Gfo/Idh/MocA family oxidoreductase [Actinomycetota bacterium]|nr:Gfo/Idh/MocA family oxidoreductase [Actinomycetota bacterium]
MPERTYGFGVVGCGVIGPMHARVAAALPSARLVAATDLVAERAKAYAAEHGCEPEADLAHLLARDDVDVVSVCTPSGTHAEVGVEAARAGKHLVVEKPIDISLAAADRLIGAVEAAGVTMTVISQHRFDPGVQQLRELLDSGSLGRLVLGSSRIKWYRSQAYYDSGDWRGTWALDGGGALMNQGVHYTDLLRWCMGPVTEVTALCATQTHEIEVEDVAIALLRFASGAVGTLEASTAVFPGLPERLEVSGTGGSAVVEDGVLVLRELLAERADVGAYGAKAAGSKPRGSSAAADPRAIGDAPHVSQVADLLAAIDGGRQPLVTGQEARNALEVVLAVYESARSGGQPVRLPLAGATTYEEANK